MSKKLFVGSLSWGTTESSLTSFFEANGVTPEKATVITDKETGRSRGFGFVEFTDADAAKALSLKDLHLDGREIVISEAKNESRESRGDSHNNRRGGEYKQRSNRRY